MFRYSHGGPMRNILLHLIVGLGLLIFAPEPFLRGQQEECPSEGLLPPEDPAYLDAKDLENTLHNRGIDVHCVLTDKLGSIFWETRNGVRHSTIEGTSSFRTDHGDFTVIFLSRGQTFANFKIITHRLKNGYVYSFAGAPHVWPINRFESGQRQYFVKHDSHLFVLGDDQLRRKLEEIFAVRAEP